MNLRWSPVTTRVCSQRTLRGPTYGGSGGEHAHSPLMQATREQTMQLNIARRNTPQAALSTLIADGIPPLLARVYAARGIASAQQLAADLGGLVPFASLQNVERMASLLADAIAAR